MSPTKPKPEAAPQPSLPPDTTAEQDVISAGQREVNLLWEHTQSRLALIIIVTFNLVVVAVILWAISGGNLGVEGEPKNSSRELVLTALTLLYGLTNLVVGFYFGRTNHQRTGGVGGENVTRSR